MAEFDELSVRVAADVMDFNQGMDRAENSLNAFDRAALQTAASADLMGEQIDDLSSEAVQTAAAMRAMGSQTESAGDDLTQTAAQATLASGSMSQLSATTTGATLASTSLSTVLVASVAPALAVVASAAVPVVAALGGLVTVAAAITGVGLIGLIAGVSQHGERLKTQFNALVDVFTSTFAPAINLAAVVIEALMEDLVAMIREAGPLGSVANEIAGSFLQLGKAVIDLLPAFASLALELTREFLPAMVRFARNVLPMVPGLLRDLVGVFRRLVPSFREAGRLLVNLAPALLEFGFTALSVVGPALSKLTSGLTKALRVFNNFDGSIQSLGVNLAVVAPIIAGIATLLGGPITIALAAVVGSVIALRKAWTSNFAGIQNLVTQFVSQLRRVLPAARSAFNAFVDGLNISDIVESLRTFEDILGNQLQQTMTDLKPVFEDIKGLLSDNSEEFEIIGGAVSGFIQAVIGLGQTVAKILGPVFRQVGIPIIRAFITTLDTAISQIANLIQLFNALKNQNFGRAGEIVGDMGEETVELGNQFIPENIQQQEQELLRTIEVVVEEDTDLTEARIEQGAENVVQQRERRSTRLQRRTP